METPSSIRRVTRSQALAASANNSTNIPMSKKVEGTEKGILKSKQRTGQDRSALFDITNDSPIVGLAMGSLETPSSYVTKRKNCGSISKNVGTPGSGEALLRGQVKTLLQKVEEEAEISKIFVDGVNRPFYHGVVIGLPAPTPNNTPQVSNLSGNESAENKGLESVTSSPVPEQFAFSQIFDGQQKKEESVESEKSLITRSLLFDFSEKSEGSVDSSSDCTSVLTYDGGSGASKVKSSTDDDDASIWSIQVNASTNDDEDDDVEDEVYDEEEEEYYDEEDEEYYCDDAILDDLCEGLSKVSVNGVEFAGKHTRFVYNSDDEIEGEEDCDAGNDDGVLKLKGLPTPKGKHVRFPMED